MLETPRGQDPKVPANHLDNGRISRVLDQPRIVPLTPIGKKPPDVGLLGLR